MKNTLNIFNSTPIENIFSVCKDQVKLQKIYEEYFHAYMRLCDIASPPIISHIEKLGKQNYCWNSHGERFYIWENGLSWRVFVGKNKGICFEVNEKASLNEAMEAWNDYFNKMIL